MSSAAPRSHSPDSAPGAALRFALELLSWAALGWAWGWLALAAGVAALALFSVRGDKHNVIIAVPGPLRLALELGVTALGLLAAYRAWGALAAGVGIVLVAIYLLIARERLRWLLHA
jgi:hypothetical protein